MRRTAWAAALVLSAAVAAAAAETPSADALLFEAPQLANAAPGTVLRYRYHRASPAGLLGPAVDDTIRLSIEPGTAPDRRRVAVELFTGERRRPAGPFEDVLGNPVLVIFLEHHLEALTATLDANPRYLKNAIRAAFREAAEVSPETVALGGSTIPGWSVTIRPFAADPHRARMRGLEHLVYRFLVGEGVPGGILAARVVAHGGAGDLIEEDLTYDPAAH